MDNHHHARAHRVLFGVDMVNPATDEMIALFKTWKLSTAEKALIARIEADAKVIEAARSVVVYRKQNWDNIYSKIDELAAALAERGSDGLQ